MADKLESLAIGTEVEVFSTFRQDWITGFEVAAVRDDRYSLRRTIDWAVLPGQFPADDVRVTRLATA
ncbi:MAG TPA: hypothetical protein VNC41_12100 [Acidimicrobiia bacterium]|nr:hypothetical protein [Acidimicrobiia bacterium]